MLQFILFPLSALRVFLRTRRDNTVEILALRQQLAVLKRKQPRPRLHPLNRVFFSGLRGLWSRWADLLVAAKLKTVVRWHRTGFRLFWRWRSRARCGRAKTTAEIRTLIRRIAHENSSWGAPKIHGEIEKLGFVVSEPLWLATCDLSAAVAAHTRVG